MTKPLNKISTLPELEAKRRELQKQARKQEQRLMRDTEAISREWHNAFRGITIARRVVNFLFPKLDVLSQVLPIIRAIKKGK